MDALDDRAALDRLGGGIFEGLDQLFQLVTAWNIKSTTLPVTGSPPCGPRRTRFPAGE